VTVTPDSPAAQAGLEETDEVLIERARIDPEAFGPLYERYVTVVYNYVFYRMSNRAEAEDMTSRVFYQALTHVSRYEHRGAPFSAWLFRIAHNLVANWHRDRQTRQTFSLDGAVLERASEEANLDDQASSREDVRELRAAFASLAPDRQQLLVLKYVQGMSNAEIGRIMRRSEGAVKALLHRTFLMLRTELGRVERPASGRE
jgi:RNA polymerase sigma-70 factor, ECF subfamily